MKEIDWDSYPVEVRKPFMRQVKNTVSLRLRMLSPELGFIYKRLQHTRQRVLNSCHKGFKRTTHFYIIERGYQQSISVNRRIAYCAANGLITLVHSQSSDEDMYKADIKDMLVYEVSPEVVETFAQLDILMKV